MGAGYHSEVGRIDRVLLKHPREAFIDQDNLNRHWQALGYRECPDYAKAVAEYEEFLTILRNEIPGAEFLPAHAQTGLDSIYVRDALLMSDQGAILCNMGKKVRKGEPAAVESYLKEIAIPVLGAIQAPGTVEGGDVVFMDERTLAVGLGYRTNAEGIRQLRELTRDVVEDIVTVPLPHGKGRHDVLHLMSLLSPVDHDLAVVYSPLLPVFFREWLLDRGMSLVEVPEEEYETMACNVLALAPRNCLMLAGNDRTRQRLEDEGVNVREYFGEEISRKGAGGPTCLTRPLNRM